MSNVSPDSQSIEAAGSDHHRSSGGARALLEAAKNLAGANATIGFGRRSDGTLGLERDSQIRRLSAFKIFADNFPPLLATGGEHAVYGSASDGIVIKIALSDNFGYIVDEEMMLDDRTFMNVPRFKHRHSLPSEYFIRWAILDQVFGLQTKFCGIVEHARGCPSLVILQPFIGAEESDIPSWEQLGAFFDAHGFARVDDRHIADPRIKSAVWYRQRDGLLMSDAFPRNFRVDATGVIIPIDLIVNIVPPGASKILPSATEPFKFPEEAPTPKLIAIAAMSSNRVIGRDGKLPWHLPEDLKFFKKTTQGHPVLMGRNTFDSIVAQLGKPLPGRRNIVLSKTMAAREGVEIIRDLSELKELGAGAEPQSPCIYLIGGAQLYETLLPQCDELLLTYITAPHEGDTLLPPFEHLFEMKEVIGTGDGFEIRRYVTSRPSL